MKIEITRESDPVTGEYCFNIEVDGRHLKCFSFKLDVAEDDVFNEQSNYAQALACVQRIKAANTITPNFETVFSEEFAETKAEDILTEKTIVND